MTRDFDIAIVGSGFGGSLLAMIANRLGRSVVLLERGAHPRFAIGESSTPLANLLLEELALRHKLPRLLPLTKWGTWQKSYPQMSCGLKRGFTFYHHSLGQAWNADPNRRNELLVAASPHDRVADTHWYRPDFDHFLVREAQALGVDYFDRVRLTDFSAHADGNILEGERDGKPVSIRARLVIDATGPRGFLHRALSLAEAPFERFPETEALYTHFTGVRRWADRIAGGAGETPPYPVDDAALHHVFEGGWIWVLRFNNGLTSAGLAATKSLADELRLSEGAPAWQRLLERLPSVQAQFAGASPTLPFVYAPRLAFRSATVTGPGWALLPSAAGFVDPLLSTGCPLTLLGVARLAELIEQRWGTETFAAGLKIYAHETQQDLAAAEQLIAALYANLDNFPAFTSLSLLYLAAASFTETARRLGRPELAGPLFLLSAHPTFGKAAQSICESAFNRSAWVSQAEVLRQQVLRAIRPVDVAGLGKLGRRNWYPVEAEDLFAAANALQATVPELKVMLTRCGF